MVFLDLESKVRNLMRHALCMICSDVARCLSYNYYSGAFNQRYNDCHELCVILSDSCRMYILVGRDTMCPQVSAHASGEKERLQ